MRLTLLPVLFLASLLLVDVAFVDCWGFGLFKPSVKSETTIEDIVTTTRPIEATYDTEPSATTVDALNSSEDTMTTGGGDNALAPEPVGDATVEDHPDHAANLLAVANLDAEVPEPIFRDMNSEPNAISPLLDIVTRGCPNAFRCTNSRCIPNYYRCDGFDDCRDGGSDEFHCDQVTCPATHFRCGSGKCIPVDQRCDTVRDCSENEDELFC